MKVNGSAIEDNLIHVNNNKQMLRRSGTNIMIELQVHIYMQLHTSVSGAKMARLYSLKARLFFRWSKELCGQQIILAQLSNSGSAHTDTHKNTYISFMTSFRKTPSVRSLYTKGSHLNVWTHVTSGICIKFFPWTAMLDGRGYPGGKSESESSAGTWFMEHGCHVQTWQHIMDVPAEKGYRIIKMD